MSHRDVHSPYSPDARFRIERPVITEVPERPFIPDRDLTFFRDGAKWTFSSGKIQVDGLDVNRLINDNPENVGFYMGVAEALNDYRKRIVTSRRQSDQFARFEAMVEAILGKLLGKLKKFYDQKMSGLSWTLQNGQLILNGINIRSFLALYRVRKTDKAKKFLKGLRTKLASLLENRRESPDYERIREIIQALYQEIDGELARDGEGDSPQAARASRRLLSSGSHTH